MTIVSNPVTSSFGTVGRCQVLLEEEISISILYAIIHIYQKQEPATSQQLTLHLYAT